MPKIRIECSTGVGPRFTEDLVIAADEAPLAYATQLIDDFNDVERERYGGDWPLRVLHSVEIVDELAVPHDWLEDDVPVRGAARMSPWRPATCQACGAKGQYSRRGDRIASKAPPECYP